MKTYQLILAAALVALSGCNKNNVENVNTGKLEGEEIGFNVVNQKATKANNAIITGTTYGTDNSFKVWGWQSQEGDFSEFADDAASNFMSNLTIEWTKGAVPATHELAWRNVEHYYYWPFTGKIGFLAVHPSNVAPSTTGWDATNDKPQAAVNGYTIAAGNKTTDLMFATNEGTRRADALPMVFKHALSQIEVQVKTDQDYSADVAFDVESVQFNNIDLSGDVTYINDVIAWSDNTTQTENWMYYNTVLEDITNSYQVFGAANVMIPQPANVLVAAVEQVGEPGDPDYVAPVAADTSETTITIGYSMEQTNSDKITGTVEVSKPQLWEAGKRYVYTLNFRLNEILFDPEATGWVGVDVTTVNIY